MKTAVDHCKHFDPINGLRLDTCPHKDFKDKCELYDVTEYVKYLSIAQCMGLDRFIDDGSVIHSYEE